MPVSCGGLRRARPAPGRRAGRGASWLCSLPGRAEPEGKAQQRGHEQQYGQLRQEEKEALVVRKIHDDVHEQRQPCQQHEEDARAQHAKRRQQEENEHGKIEDAAQHRVQNAGKRQRLIEKEHDESGHGRSQRHDGPPAEQGQQHRIEGRREDRQADEQEDVRLRERHGRRDGVGEIVPQARRSRKQHQRHGEQAQRGARLCRKTKLLIHRFLRSVREALIQSFPRIGARPRRRRPPAPA